VYATFPGLIGTLTFWIQGYCGGRGFLSRKSSHDLDVFSPNGHLKKENDE
jgi:hypothetical protein